MIVLSHPTGNTFVRALLSSMQAHGLDFEFFTTLAWTEGNWWSRCLPGHWQREFSRRSYAIPRHRCRTRPWLEAGRLMLGRVNGSNWLRRAGWDVDAVYRDLDRHVAREISRSEHPVHLVHAYEDGAWASFHAARAHGARCSYELPILYWETSRRLLEEEAERWPEWASTLGAVHEPPGKLERKTAELDLADVVICPSSFVHQSLPAEVRARKECVVAEFGSPSAVQVQRVSAPGGPLRVLFAGTLTQRKGLADLFAAWRLLKRHDVELVVMGAPLMPWPFYRKACPDFVYEPTRSHAGVLELMTRCDVLILPSIVEGRALVQQEALRCGLPLIITPNTGGEDLIEPGRTGFVVPIRRPDALAERLDWFANHREELETMRECCRQKAASYSWDRYGDLILESWQGRKVLSA